MDLPDHPIAESLPAPVDLSVATGLPHARRNPWLALLVVGPLGLLLLKWFPTLDQPIFHDPLIHVLIAGSASLLGVVLALLVLHVAYRAQDGRIFLVGMGFLGIASIFLIHSISTPNVLMLGRGVATSWSTLLSMVMGSIFFAASGVTLSTAANSRLMRHARMWLAVYLLGWLVYSWAFLVAIPPTPAAVPSAGGATSGAVATTNASAAPAATIMPDAKRDQLFNGQQQGTAAATHAGHDSDGQAAPTTQISAVSPAAWLDIVRRMLLFLGLGCFVFAIWRHALLYHHSPSPAGYAILCGIVLFGEALVTQSVWVVYGLSFWLSHAQEFIGFAVISYAVLGAYRRGQAEGLLESLLLPGTRAHIQAEYALAMDSLVDALARGEQPAPSLRQALRGPFGMSENQMRVLERAATAVAQERQQRQELERLNEALRQLEQARTDLTHMVVHDLKTPLTAQIGFLELLQMSPLAEDERMLLEGALRSSMTLSRLITDMLDVARLESGRLELDWSSFRACELLEGCAAEVRGWLAKECKTIQIEISDATPLLYADRHIVRRVMLNLVSNAIKHTPDGTCITLRAVPAGPLSLESGTAHMPADLDGCSASDIRPTSVVLEVEDTGAGIAPRDLERIFAKFERIDNAGGRRQDSTGLGLTFCRLAVEAHGGTLSVSSVVGVGTVFRVVLPGVGSA